MSFVRRGAVFACAGLFALSAACNKTDKPQENAASAQEFQTSEVAKNEGLSGTKLAFAVKNNIPHTMIKRRFKNDFPAGDERKIPDRDYEGNGYTMDAEFPSLTKPQYDLLMANYRGQGVVPFEAGKKYFLLDFLPPMVQAMAGKRLTAKVTSVPLSPAVAGPLHLNPEKPMLTVESTMNCWDTVINFHMNLGLPLKDQKVQATHMFRNDARAALTDVGGFTTMATTVDGRNAGRKTGDLVYFKDPSFGIAHVAVWIDDDLYFEKPNGFSEDYFRIAQWKDIQALYTRNEMVFLRLADRSKLKEPKSYVAKNLPFPGAEKSQLGLDPNLLNRLVFGVDSNKLHSALVVEIPFKQDGATKRAVLDPSGFDERMFALQ